MFPVGFPAACADLLATLKPAPPATERTSLLPDQGNSNQHSYHVSTNWTCSLRRWGGPAVDARLPYKSLGARQSRQS